ncbi:MAG: hypothetical protein O7J95_02770 [Planctomycetota bacterium]|nr:hypothetical protein [Planctomycetota bacterium]
MKTRHDIRRPVDRRSFLKFSLMSLTAAGFGTMPGFLRRARAAVNPGKKFLFIFLRGGQDAIQTVIPYMDGELAAARPLRGIGVNPADAHPLDGGPAALYPVFQEATLPNSSNPGAKLSDIYHGGGVEGFAGGDFAVVHRVGYENQNRSHFSSQQFYENGVPGNVQLEKGVFNNYITANPGAGVLRGATLDRNQMVMMKGDTLIPVIRSIGDFRLPSNVPIGTYPPPGSGLKGGYGQRGFDASIPYTTRTYGTGRALLDSVEFFEANLSGDYTPTSSLPGRIENGAERYYNGIDHGRFRGFI